MLNLKLLNQGQEGTKFGYATIKVKNIKSQNQTGQQKRQIVQIIDISHKILYNDAKAEQKFHVLMNAAVSHELRNPLNSLISGIDTMQDYFLNLKEIYEHLKDEYPIVAEKIKLVS